MTTFSAITLKRGMSAIDDAWQWFDLVTRGANYGLRFAGKIDVFNGNKEQPALTWTLDNVLPLKFKGADLSATATQVAIEEIQIGHEGLHLQRGAGGGS